MSDSELKKIAENAKAIVWWRRFFQKIISTYKISLRDVPALEMKFLQTLF